MQNRVLRPQNHDSKNTKSIAEELEHKAEEIFHEGDKKIKHGKKTKIWKIGEKK